MSSISLQLFPFRESMCIFVDVCVWLGEHVSVFECRCLFLSSWMFLCTYGHICDCLCVCVSLSVSDSVCVSVWVCVGLSVFVCDFEPLACIYLCWILLGGGVSNVQRYVTGGGVDVKRYVAWMGGGGSKCRFSALRTYWMFSRVVIDIESNRSSPPLHRLNFLSYLLLFYIKWKNDMVNLKTTNNAPDIPLPLSAHQTLDPSALAYRRNGEGFHSSYFGFLHLIDSTF